MRAFFYCLSRRGNVCVGLLVRKVEEGFARWRGAGCRVGHRMAPQPGVRKSSDEVLPKRFLLYREVSEDSLKKNSLSAVRDLVEFAIV